MQSAQSLDQTILGHLIFSDEYAKKVLPYLKPEYFQDLTDRTIFQMVEAFYDRYKGRPTVEALVIETDTVKGLSEDLHANIKAYLANLHEPERPSDQWIVDSTEKFCADRAIYNAIMDSIHILDGKDKDKQDKGAIPKILADALAVSFDTHIGHDFIENADERYAAYHRVEERIPFDLELLNTITGGGLPKKTLNVILAGTGVGKTMTMCHFAGANLSIGKNVLYITMEMAESEIAKRIDANLMGVNIEALKELTEAQYQAKIELIKNKTHGKLIIKEYPTAGAHVGHFRHLINELLLKRNFKPDIIYVDYMNICMSSRFKLHASNVNSYTYIKAIAEELRGLGVEKNVPIVTATQLNRGGMQNSDPDMTDTSESFGVPHTADFLIALISSEEFEALNQIMVKQLKSRYNDIGKFRRIMLGIDKSKMRLYDLPTGQGVYTGPDGDDTGPAFDKGKFGQEMLKRDDQRWEIKKNPLGGKKRDFSTLRTS